MQVSELTRLKHLEAENQHLKQLYAKLRLENHAIKEVLAGYEQGRPDYPVVLV